MKLLRAIRFDDSDTRVFAQAAEPPEWVVSGAFAFADLAPDAISGKVRQAFANGFLGVVSLGRSTFATVSEASEADADEIALRLADHFVAAWGAPSVAAALPAAREEVAFVADLVAAVPINTVFTLRRTLAPDGSIKEELRTIQPPSGEPQHTRIWTIDADET